MELLYIEIKKSTEEISAVCPYKPRSGYKVSVNGYDSIGDDTYEGFIVDVNHYVIKCAKFRHYRNIPLVVHQYIITRGRVDKIKNIKERING